MADHFGELRERLQRASHIARALSVLGWDEETYMPPGGAAARGAQRATLAGIWHREFTAPALGDALGELEAEYASLPEDDPRRALVRETRRAYDKQTRLPHSLVEEMERASSRAHEAWVAARGERRFATFAPAFARIVELRRQAAEAIGYAHEPYDALIDASEPGLSTQDAQAMLDALKGVLLPLVQEIAARKDRIDRSMLFGHFDDSAQWAAGMDAAEAIGFDFRRGRQDRSIHPFTTSFSVDDVRITTRILPEYMPGGFFATLHEAGHGLYEQGLPAEWSDTPAGEPISSGVHESQSRLWENLVGRSSAFWEFFLPRAKRYFPSQFAGVDARSIYRAVNFAEPSSIRVEADEVTYNLHIALRFELERALLEGDLLPQDVPQAWAEKMHAYLGIKPQDDLDGALQDIHWTFGLGGFIGYTVGNVISVQLWRAAERDLHDLPAMIARGEFAPLLGWLRQNVHQHGSILSRDEMLRRATGTAIDPAPYVQYVEDKYKEIYGF